jgi:hypothetical protein
LLSGRSSLLFSHLLCLIIVVTVSLPALQAPRLEADDYRKIVPDSNNPGSSG